MGKISIPILTQLPLIIIFSAYTIWSVQPGSSLFSWHPTCMTLFQLLALEGVLLFKTIPLKWRVTVHWIIQVVGLSALITGFGVIFLNKELRDKPHFTSNHGLAGLTTLSFMILQSGGGAIAKFSAKIKFISAKQSRSLHRWCGIVAHLLAFSTVFLVTADKFIYFILVVLPSIIIMYLNIVRPKLALNSKK